jgi:hypothetical protein
VHRIRRPLRRNASTIAAVAAVVLAQLIVLVVLATAAGAQTEAPPPDVAYAPPVDEPLIDVFRPPATPYGPGNRGIDFATTDGEPVRAAAAGQVVFAGAIGATSHVVVLHADGLRTSYSFLAGAGVRRGELVEQGDVLGTANAGDLHFGARLADGTYVDPLVLLGWRTGPRPHVHLVPDDDTKPLAEVEERSHLVDTLRGLVGDAVGASGDAAGWLRDHAQDAAERKVVLARAVASDLQSLAVPLTRHLAIAAATWQQQQGPCTPPDEPAPAAASPDHERRIVVLVGGLGSATGSAAVLDVDTAALGYAAADVHQFSYRPDRGPYQQADTLGDIGAAGERLAADLQALSVQHPGVPIDVIAHSQGGLVARAAITPTRARAHPPHVATLVTLATPHRGTDLATAAAGVEGSRAGRLLLAGAAHAPGVGIDPGAASVQQMAEVSGFVGGLPDHGWPPDTRVVSVAARGDPVVARFNTAVAGAPHRGVSVGGATSAAHPRPRPR